MYSMYAECQTKISVMIWGCITWYGSGSLCKVDGNINAVKYIEIHVLIIIHVCFQ
jgi:hypothetical protein